MVFLLCDWKSAWKINFHSLTSDEQLIIDDAFAQAGLKDFRIQFEAILKAWIEGKRIQMSIWELTQQASSIVSINFISSDISEVEDNTALVHNYEDVDFSLEQYLLSRTVMVSKMATNQKDTFLCAIIATSVSDNFLQYDFNVIETLFRFTIKTFLQTQFPSNPDVLKNTLLTKMNVMLSIQFNLLPRTIQGLNLLEHERSRDNPFQLFQRTKINRIFDRLTNKAYLEEEGWKIIIHMTKLHELFPEIFGRNSAIPRKMVQKEVTLKKNMTTCEPMVGTLFISSNTGAVQVHSVVIDRIQTGYFLVIDSYGTTTNELSHEIEVSRPRYFKPEPGNDWLLNYSVDQRGVAFVHDQNMDILNEDSRYNMIPGVPYLFPVAFSLELL